MINHFAWFSTALQSFAALKFEMLRRNISNFSAANDCKAVENQAKWLIKTDQLAEGKEPDCNDFFFVQKK